MGEFMSNKTTTSHNSNTYVLVLASIASIAGLLFGFDTGVIAGALQFIARTFHITTQTNNTIHHYSLLGIMQISGITLKEFIVAAVPAGALIGSILSSICSHRIGRKGSIIITAVLFIIGTLIAAAAPSTNILIIGRLLMGLAVGLSAMVAPMYLSEVSPPNIRGAVIFLYQMAITIGILSAFIINYIFNFSGNWRAMFAAGIVPSLLLFIGMLMLPASPRWLLQNGRHKHAHKVLKKLRGAAADISQEVADIVSISVKKSGGIKRLFGSRSRMLVVVTFGLFVFQQFTGINTILYYAPTIFREAGFVGSSSQILGLITTGAINVCATMLGIWLVDKIGRRKLLFIGMVGMISCLFVMGDVYHHWFGVIQATRWITLAAALLIVVFFAISISGIAYIMMAELFPLNVRNVGMAIASSANWGFNLLVTASFLTLVHSLGIGNTYWLYASLSTAGILFVTFLVPETKNVSLETIEKNLYAGKKLRHLGEMLSLDTRLPIKTQDLIPADLQLTKNQNNPKVHHQALKKTANHQTQNQIAHH
jgi:sugar porter (SP) family MFS transporter